MGRMDRKFKRQQQKAQGLKPGTRIEIPREFVDNLRKSIIEEVMNKIKVENVHVEKEVSNIRKEMDQFKANAITVNNLLSAKGVFQENEYKSLYNDVLKNVIGLVDSMNRMHGFVGITFYNM